MTYLSKARMALLGLAVALASSLTAAPGLLITYRVEKVDSLTAVELVRLYNGNAYEQGFFSVDYRGEVDVAGYSSPESDDRRWHSVEAGMEDGQEFTMVQTVDMQTREQHLVAAGHDYAYYSAPLAELANPAPNQVRVYESKWIKPVRVTVYSRVLTDQEITAAMGAAPEKHAPSEMDKDKTSFSFLGVIDLIIIVAVIMLIVRARKEKLKPMSLDDLAKAGRGELTQEQARQEALRYLDEANAPWQWEPLADQEGYGCSYPKSAKELRQSREALKKAVPLCPGGLYRHHRHAHHQGRLLAHGAQLAVSRLLGRASGLYHRRHGFQSRGLAG